MEHLQRRLIGGRRLADDVWQIRVWAPGMKSMAIHLLSPIDRIIPLTDEDMGYWAANITTSVDDSPGQPPTLYKIRLPDGRELPDPASRYQPEGVHGPSQLVDRMDDWHDADWRGLPLAAYVIYELHIGAFTPTGTFDAAIERLDDLVELGITAIEIMPIGQFPGTRNWGYDSADIFAAQQSYGGPWGFARLVDACHARGLAVILDVVYNHLGPEGNYLAEFGPYFTDAYKTPWGRAINFDGPQNGPVRNFFIENALQWIEEFHVDALRLDAIHAIKDFSAWPFLADLATAAHSAGARLAVGSAPADRAGAGRQIYLIAESDLNDPRILAPTTEHGMDLDAQWSDDLHHALHVILTGERAGYYEDYSGLGQLASALRTPFVYAGDYSPHRQRRHGAPVGDLPGWRFVVSSQNHDQIGNRMLGERLSQLVDIPRLKLAASLIALSPYLPLFFMGEEYGAAQPFLYFVDHSDQDVIAAVREGRRAEFAAFAWQGDVPDPQDPVTFARSLLVWEEAQEGRHVELRAFYRALLRLRPLITAANEHIVLSYPLWDTITMRYQLPDGDVLVIWHCGDGERSTLLTCPNGAWRVLLQAADWSAAPALPGIPSAQSQPDTHQGDIPHLTHQLIESDGALHLTLAPWDVMVARWQPDEGAERDPAKTPAEHPDTRSH